MHRRHDIALVGGGVVGCALLFELTNQGYDVLLLEKNADIVAEASSGNSGMLHTGFDAPLDSLEMRCIRETQKKIYDVLNGLGLPYNMIGATMVSWTQEQLSGLTSVEERAKQAGITGVRRLSLSELYMREPHLNRGARGALLVPSETVVDPWLTAVAMAHSARQKGANLLLEARVTSCDHLQTGGWKIETTKSSHFARCIVNCAGLYGDIVDKLGGFTNFRIKPRKGQYIIYKKTASSLINSSILPVPTDKTKGVIVFRSVYNNVIVGPTADDVDSRLQAAIDDQTTLRLRAHGSNCVPTLPSHRVVRMYTGVRPATEIKDYIIRADNERNWITVGGIRSTGLSGCLGIASHVHGLIRDSLGLEPSKHTSRNIIRKNYDFSREGVMAVDGCAYRITHPLTLAGHAKETARL